MMKKGRVMLLDLLKRLTIMPIGYPLSKRRLIVHTHNSMNQLIIQRLHKNLNAAFLGSSHILTACPRQSLPPLSKASCVDGCDAVAFRVIIILQSIDGKLLCKGQN